MTKFFKKYHKWLGILLAYFILEFAFSGIILNHRKALSFININRKYLPKEYSYHNWNNAAVKSTLKLNNDTILIYGNIGIWATDSTFQHFSNFNAGFPKGIDNKKISKLLLTKQKNILAGTFFGLFNYNFKQKKWQKIILPTKKQRITDIIEKQDSIFILTRSYLLKTKDLKNFNKTILPPPQNYDNKIGLFKTIWVIHSGEIYGIVGKLIIDIAALIFAFLTISGIIIFVNKNELNKKKTFGKEKNKLIKSNRWNIKWHNKLGWITLILLLITTTTGMFLRPPLLISIANAKVNKIKFTELDTKNPWFDNLRRILYDKNKHRFIIATMNGFYYSDDNFHSYLKRYPVQPPASIMGINVFKKHGHNSYLVGSFDGLFLWNPQTKKFYDYITKQKYNPNQTRAITGFSSDFRNQEICFDYDLGAFNISGNQHFVPMPEQIRNSPISLWNVALEFHTARIYESLIGEFYVLIVPLVGFAVIFILISGFIVWYKQQKIKNKKIKNHE